MPQNEKNHIGLPHMPVAAGTSGPTSVIMQNVGGVPIPPFSCVEVVDSFFDVSGNINAPPNSSGYVLLVRRFSSWLPEMLASTGQMTLEPGQAGPGWMGSILPIAGLASPGRRFNPVKDTFNLLPGFGPLQCVGLQGDGVAQFTYDPTAYDNIFVCTGGQEFQGVSNDGPRSVGDPQFSECDGQSLPSRELEVMFLFNGALRRMFGETKLVYNAGSTLDKETVWPAHRLLNGDFVIKEKNQGEEGCVRSETAIADGDIGDGLIGDFSTEGCNGGTDKKPRRRKAVVRGGCVKKGDPVILTPTGCKYDRTTGGTSEQECEYVATGAGRGCEWDLSALGGAYVEDVKFNGRVLSVAYKVLRILKDKNGCDCKVDSSPTIYSTYDVPCCYPCTDDDEDKCVTLFLPYGGTKDCEGTLILGLYDPELATDIEGVSTPQNPWKKLGNYTLLDNATDVEIYYNCEGLPYGNGIARSVSADVTGPEDVEGCGKICIVNYNEVDQTGGLGDMISDLLNERYNPNGGGNLTACQFYNPCGNDKLSSGICSSEALTDLVALGWELAGEVTGEGCVLQGCANCESTLLADTESYEETNSLGIVILPGPASDHYDGDWPDTDCCTNEDDDDKRDTCWSLEVPAGGLEGDQANTYWAKVCYTDDLPPPANPGQYCSSVTEVGSKFINNGGALTTCKWYEVCCVNGPPVPDNFYRWQLGTADADPEFARVGNKVCLGNPLTCSGIEQILQGIDPRWNFVASKFRNGVEYCYFDICGTDQPPLLDGFNGGNYDLQKRSVCAAWPDVEVDESALSSCCGCGDNGEVCWSFRAPKGGQVYWTYTARGVSPSRSGNCNTSPVRVMDTNHGRVSGADLAADKGTIWEICCTEDPTVAGRQDWIRSQAPHPVGVFDGNGNGLTAGGSIKILFDQDGEYKPLSGCGGNCDDIEDALQAVDSRWTYRTEDSTYCYYDICYPPPNEPPTAGIDGDLLKESLCTAYSLGLTSGDIASCCGCGSCTGCPDTSNTITLTLDAGGTDSDYDLAPNGGSSWAYSGSVTQYNCGGTDYAMVNSIELYCNGDGTMTLRLDLGTDVQWNDPDDDPDAGDQTNLSWTINKPCCSDFTGESIDVVIDPGGTACEISLTLQALSGDDQCT